MEGVRRIIISIDDEKIYLKRAPFKFESFKKMLEEMKLNIGDQVEVKFGNKKGKICDQKSYNKWIELSKYEGLIVNFNTFVEGDSERMPEEEVEEEVEEEEVKIEIEEFKARGKRTRNKDKEKKKEVEEKQNVDDGGKGVEKKRKLEESKEKRIKVDKKSPELKSDKIKQKKVQAKVSTKRKDAKASVKISITPAAPEIPPKSSKKSTPKKSPKKVFKASPKVKNSPAVVHQTPPAASEKPFQPIQDPNASSESNSKSQTLSLFSNPSSGSALITNSSHSSSFFITPSKTSGYSQNHGLFSTPPPTSSLFGTTGSLFTPKSSNILADPSASALQTPLLSLPSASPAQVSLFPSTPGTTAQPSISFTLITDDLPADSPLKFDFWSSFGIIKNEGEMELYDPINKTRRKHSFPSFKRSSRFLKTDQGILVTGGSGSPYQAFILKEDFSIIPVVSMSNPRFWHSTGFIDGFPAVALGAECSSEPKKYISSVEVYKNGNWEKYPDAHYSRASSIMVSDGKFTYLIGGVVTDGKKNSIIKAIEKWNGSSWVLLSVEMKTALLSPGCFCIKSSELMIFGGETEGGKHVDSSYVLNLENGEIKELKTLKKKNKFSYGQIKRTGNILQVLDSVGEFSEIELPSQEDEKHNAELLN